MEIFSLCCPLPPLDRIFIAREENRKQHTGIPDQTRAFSGGSGGSFFSGRMSCSFEQHWPLGRLFRAKEEGYRQTQSAACRRQFFQGAMIAMHSRQSWCRKTFHRGVVQPFSRFALAFFLALTGQFAVPCYAGGPDEENPRPGVQSETVIAGLVVHLQRWTGSRTIRILLDRVPLTANDTPRCRKPTGRLLTVLAGKGFSRKKQPSAFVVLPRSSDPLPTHLAVGDCLTVEGNDIHRVDILSPADEDRIRITKTLDTRNTRVRIVRGLRFHRWRQDSFPESSPVASPERLTKMSGMTNKKGD
jgi:hypothetical protein